MSAEEDLRNDHTPEFSRSGIVRIFQQRFAERFLFGRLIIAQRAWEKSDDRIDQDHGGAFTA